MSSTLLRLPYTCTHTRLILITDSQDPPHPTISSPSADTSILYAPAGQARATAEIFRAVFAAAPLEREERCPSCKTKAGEEGRVSVAEKGEGVEAVERGEKGEGKEVVEQQERSREEGEEEGQGQGWWDVLDLEAEDTEAEVESDWEDEMRRGGR